MFGGVGQSLAGDEPRGCLEHRIVPVVGDGEEFDVALVAADEVPERWRHTAAGEHRREHAVGHGTELRKCTLEFVDGPREQLVEVGASLDHAAVLLASYSQGQRHETLLGPVMQIAFDTAPL